MERAATLLLATSALAGAALVGWGGFVLDLRPLDSIAAGLIRAVAGGSAPWPGTAETRVGLRWQDIAPLAGTMVTLLFYWHALSLLAEVVLLVAAQLGWLWRTSLRPLWLTLDVLNSAPLAAPKRLVLATALASQVLVRSASASLAAPQMSQVPVAIVRNSQAADEPPVAQSDDTPAPPAVQPGTLTHRVRPGDTLSGISLQYYGHAGFWPVLLEANRGAIMAASFGGRNPIRLTSPNYLLPGWDMVIPPIGDHLEDGEQEDELIYVVQRGDALWKIGQRFGVSVKELTSANLGAQTPDGHVFTDPNLIWPGLRLRIHGPRQRRRHPRTVLPNQPRKSRPRPDRRPLRHPWRRLSLRHSRHPLLQIQPPP